MLMLNGLVGTSLPPNLLYRTGCDVITPPPPQHDQQQSDMVKQCLCLGKLGHHPDLLQTMTTDKIDVLLVGLHLKLSHLPGNCVSIRFQDTHAL